ncbi:hypothetical protein IM876_09110 [Serratia plymuthica]|uniref:hypothetical protein n=1 Tax=Serratia plymuthica TaxID=82996 RepID=UPI0019283D98|nr:hypothetical protein [Serratia plymuthica]MBL3522821.1 hypothetical protein [Serratia plymuthica]
MTKQETYAVIVADVLAAIDCADRGETHWRINGMTARTTAHYASFNPPRPAHLLPIERRPFSRENPYVPKEVQPAEPKRIVRLVGTCWEFPDGTRMPDFWKADQKAKQLGMVLESHQGWRFSETE